ncbi:MAG: 50S ribosomal protein L11 methyltransferase [Alphaproteobacteria bacterium]|nr:50S ribosomal protein L11 methyltransferase [Alphaproteobacteria bacterium]
MGRQLNYRDYWEANIDKWGDYYFDISHGQEELSGPRWCSQLYRRIIGKLERKLMVDRYRRTIAFLDAHIKPGVIFSDVGCGTGIFVVEALRRGAIVNAIDFAQSALEITQDRVNKYASTGVVTYYPLDVRQQALPRSDVTLAMGLAPYVAELEPFFANVLANTKLMYCLYVDPSHWANRIRTLLPALNVRHLQFHRPHDVDLLYARHNWQLIERQKFATGYLDLAKAA